MKCATVRTLALLTACLFNLHCAGAAASKCAAACSAPAPPADAATGPWEDLVKPSASHRIFRQMAGESFLPKRVRSFHSECSPKTKNPLPGYSRAVGWNQVVLINALLSYSPHPGAGTVQQHMAPSWRMLNIAELSG